jgi:dTDP-L-rhamnose 4-epimerase
MLPAALKGVDAVIHLCAEVGVGQSMYEIDRYVDVNERGTAILLKALSRRPVERLIVASSMSIYGEGLYKTRQGEPVETATRDGQKSWDPVDMKGESLIPVPTPEWKRPALASVYAITKYCQERLCLSVAAAYGMRAVALRLFNVYGPGQALSNPYTGVLAIFAARLLNGQRPLVFEDGGQRRDFVHVEDVVHAFILALEHPEVNGEVFNIGSGRSCTVAQVARLLARHLGRSELEPEVLHKARVGDIRHCFSDLQKARERLGYVPRYGLEEGVAALGPWLAGQSATDGSQIARRELEERGLVA